MDKEKKTFQEDRRKTLKITNKKFQMSFMVFCFAIGLVATLISLIGMWFIVNGISNSVAEIRNLDWNQIEDMMVGEMAKGMLLLSIVGITNIVVTAIISFFFSHRVSG